MSFNKGINIDTLTKGGRRDFRPQNSYYVAPNGTDTNEGSLLNPFQTIGKAISVVENLTTLSPTSQAVIHIYNGQYNENLTITKPYYGIVGVYESELQNEVCEITGTISINIPTGTSVVISQIMLEGFSLTGNIIDSSTSLHAVNLANIRIFVPSGQTKAFEQLSTANHRTYFKNVYISQGSLVGGNTDPLITIQNGYTLFSEVEATQRNKGNILKVLPPTSAPTTGNSTFRITNSLFTTDYTGSDMLPLADIDSLGNTFGSCGFAVSSTTLKAAGSSVIYLQSGASIIL